jgi:TonB family protein
MNLYYTLILSLIFHIFFCWALVNIEVPDPFTEKVPIEVIVVNKAKQIIRQTQAPQQMLEENNNPARFWAAQNQRVKEEVRAQKSGLSQNRTRPRTTLKIPPEPQVNKSSQSKKKIVYFKPNPIDLGKDFKLEGTSTIGEALPNRIKLGHFTSLNTDRYLYYSFFARIDELIRFRWESQIDNFIYSLSNRNYRGDGTTEWHTKITIRLNSDGSYHDAVIKKPSGIRQFDLAAVMAFQDAEMFPNPPEEMVKQDGFIYLHYSFLIDWNPRAQSTDNLAKVRLTSRLIPTSIFCYY